MHELVCFLSVGKCYYKGCCIIFKDLWLWLNRNKFCHYLTKPIITRIIVSLVFKNVIMRTACIVFRDFMSLVKHDQILSLSNQAEGRSQGGAEGAAAPPLSLIERFRKDDTTPLITPKRGKNDVEMLWANLKMGNHGILRRIDVTFLC